MAMLKKALVAAVACGAIAFTASGFAQTGATGATAGSAAGTASNLGSTSTNTGASAETNSGTTPSASAQAANPAGAPAAGTALGGSGSRNHVAVVHNITHHQVRRVARNVTVHRIRRFRVTTHHVITPASTEAMPGAPGVGSTTAIEGLNLGNTATPIAGLSARQMAMVNSRERNITVQLNRAQLQGSTVG